MISWLDVMALFVFATSLAMGIRLGAPFTLAVVPAVVLYLVLASFLPSSILVVVAAILGVIMAFVAQYIPLPRMSDATEAIVGGMGGMVWGTLLALAILISFPSEYVASSGTLRYPSAQLPQAIASGVSSSPFAQPLFAWVSGNPFLREVLLPQVQSP